ncbi:MAG: class I mannose-6-phosphate isomerase [Clostridia bacterium]|nr:class I mannose-6-phosphate isomerase [Clostridia bacterium]
MYPLLLKPVIKDYIWGGRRLIDEYGYEANGEVAAEAWVLSCREGNENVVLNGEYKGKLLSEVPWVDKEKFPLLVKLIDAERDLSIQVHPSKECAALYEGDSPKTEMWYILDSKEDARVILGFNEQFEKKKRENKNDFLKDVSDFIKNGTITDVCRSVSVRQDDMVFVEPGTLHAICRGIFLAEVQQNSDTTYRVYDYGRLGADGRPRQLHVERALDALKFSPDTPLAVKDETVMTDHGSVRDVAIGDVGSKIILLDGQCGAMAEGTYHVLVLSGIVRVAWEKESLELSKGDSVLIPGGLAHTVSGKAKLLVSAL